MSGLNTLLLMVYILYQFTILIVATGITLIAYIAFIERARTYTPFKISIYIYMNRSFRFVRYNIVSTGIKTSEFCRSWPVKHTQRIVSFSNLESYDASNATAPIMLQVTAGKYITLKFQWKLEVITFQVFGKFGVNVINCTF